MVLLGRRLAIPLEELVGLSLKQAATAKENADVLASLSARAKAGLEELVRLDAVLYAHYNRTFWRSVADEDAGFEADVSRFDELTRQFNRRCQGNPQDAECAAALWQPPRLKCEIGKQVCEARSPVRSRPLMLATRRALCRGIRSVRIQRADGAASKPCPPLEVARSAKPRRGCRVPA